MSWGPGPGAGSPSARVAKPQLHHLHPPALFPPLLQRRRAPGTVSAAAGRSLQHLPSPVGSELGGHGGAGAGALARRLIPLHPQSSPSPRRRPQKWRLPSPSSLKAACWRTTTAMTTVMMTTTMLTATWYGAEAGATASLGWDSPLVWRSTCGRAEEGSQARGLGCVTPPSPRPSPGSSRSGLAAQSRRMRRKSPQRNLRSRQPRWR